MEIEPDRVASLGEARESLHLSEGETIESRFAPGTFGYHELLDRVVS